MKYAIALFATLVLGGCAGVTFHMPSPMRPGVYQEVVETPSGKTVTTYSYQPTCWSCYSPMMYSPPVYFYWGRF